MHCRSSSGEEAVECSLRVRGAQTLGEVHRLSVDGAYDRLAMWLPEKLFRQLDRFCGRGGQRARSGERSFQRVAVFDDIVDQSRLGCSFSVELLREHQQLARTFESCNLG